MLRLLRERSSARAARRDSLRDMVAARRVILPRGATAGETRVEVMGAAEGTAGTEITGGGGAVTRLALPTPLGSLTELLRPPALPTPLIPLTPASWAEDVAVKLTVRAKMKKADLPNMMTLQELPQLTNREPCCSAFAPGGAVAPSNGPDRDTSQT